MRQGERLPHGRRFGADGVEQGGKLAHWAGRKTAALTPLPGQTVWGKGANSHTGQSGNCRPDTAPGQAPHGRRAFLCRGGGTTQLGLHVIIEEKPPGVDRQGADQKGETDSGD